MGKPKNRLKTFGFWFYHELLPILGHKDKVPLFNARNEMFLVRTGSTRLECFKQTPKCVSCHRVGVLWLLQSHKEESPHLNLYAVEKRSGGLVLMTQDHIIPKAHGGSSEQTNLQTMCSICNQAKGCSLPTNSTAA